MRQPLAFLLAAVLAGPLRAAETMPDLKRQDQWTQTDMNRVARFLRSRGWKRYKAGPREAREWRYRRVSQ